MVRGPLRTHTVSPRARHWVVWTPRCMLMLFVAILALFSLDVLVEGRSATDVLVGLLIHNAPAIVLLAAGIAAWRWPWVGAVAMLVFAVWWLATFSAVGFPPSVYLLLAGLPMMLAALFLLSWRLPDQTRNGRVTVRTR